MYDTTISPQEAQFIVQHAPYLTLKYSEDGLVQYISPAVTELLGYTPAELIGQRAQDYIHKMDYDSVRQTLRTTKTGRRPIALELRLRHKSGEYRWFRTVFIGDNATAAPQVVWLFAQDVALTKDLARAMTILAHQSELPATDEIFRILVSQITLALRVQFAFITQVEQDGSHVRMLAFWKGVDFGEPYAYPLHDTPCDDVINGAKTCMYPIGIQGRFPEDKDLVALDAQGYLGMPLFNRQRHVIGHIAILDNKPLKLAETDMALARLFAVHAGLALEAILNPGQHVTVD